MGEASVVYLSDWSWPRRCALAAHVSSSGKIRLRGTLDVETAPTMRRALELPIVRGGSITLDLRRLDHLSPAGIGVLVDAVKALAGQGRLDLQSPQFAVAHMLHLSGFDTWLREPRERPAVGRTDEASNEDGDVARSGR